MASASISGVRITPNILTHPKRSTPLHSYRRLSRLVATPPTQTYRGHPKASNGALGNSSNSHRMSVNSNLKPTVVYRPFHSVAKNLSSLTATSSPTIPHTSVHIAASSSGKGRKFQAEKSTFDYQPPDGRPLGQQIQGTIYQKRRARPDSGQDAYFATSVGQISSVSAFGVADGVGGWVDQGVDPADFSHGLCSYMTEVAFNWPRDNPNKSETLGPRRLLELGYDATIQDPQILAGGTTACVAIADEQGRMRVANLGDSGFIQLRLGTVHHYSNPQTHAFNTPYQLSITPPEILTQAAIFGGLPLNDLPDRADVAEHRLQHGDLVILATDGVWDNLSPQDILHAVSKIMREAGAWEKTSDKGIVVTDRVAALVQKIHSDQPSQTTLQAKIAASIVGEAKTASMDRKRDGPFAKAVQKEYPLERFHGGKVDDITVVVAIALSNQQIPDAEVVKAKL